MKLVNSAKFYKADIIIAGGDLTGKAILPIVPVGNLFEAQFLGRNYRVGGDEIIDLEKEMRNAGFYPFRTTREHMEEMRAKPSLLDELFSKLMCETLRRWVGIAEERLEGSTVKCILNAGNDDRMEVDAILNSSEYVIHPEGKVVKLDDNHEMISTGYTNITPWNCPRDISEEQLSKKIEDMALAVSNMKKCIFNFHCPPYDSTLDSAPKLTTDLKPVVSPGGRLMVPVGSTAVRSAIEKYQPLLGLHGHIHESRGSVKIGRTVCVNPGSEYGEGTLKGVLLAVNDDTVGRPQFTSG